MVIIPRVFLLASGWATFSIIHARRKNTPIMTSEISRIVLLLFLFVIYEIASSAHTDAYAPLVKVKQGLVKGKKERSSNGREFFSFSSIPYAKPPVGKLRFKDPVEGDPWVDVLEARSIENYCFQLHIISSAHNDFSSFIGNEDCLYLNVFTPKVDAEANLPVMVFIHGGGFIWGGASEHPPYTLLNEDIILVTLNYRLNLFGFLSTEDPQMPGNYGIKDQILALKWVKENIKSFGGNPNMVTIFGESAGSVSVHANVLSPKANGLFQRAIMQSGNMLCTWSQFEGEKLVARKVGELVNCSLVEGKTDEFVNCLQSIDSKTLLSVAIESFKMPYIFSLLFKPRVDQDVLPEKPEILLRDKKFNKVDIISGNNRDEGALFVYTGLLPLAVTNLSAPISLNLQYEENAEGLANQLYDFYLQGKPKTLEATNELVKLLGDRMFSIPQDLTAFFHSKDETKNVYQYSLEHRGQRSLSDLLNPLSSNLNWVSHFDDLFYLFSGGLVFRRPLETEEDISVQNTMVKLWTNFAKTGNPTPNGNDLGFTWSKATPNDFSFLNITTFPHMVKDIRKEQRKIHINQKTRQNLLLFPDGATNITENIEKKRQ